MRTRAYNALIEMGASVITKGAQYIADAMVIYDAADEWTRVGTMDLYSKIAEMHGTKPANVERNIRYALLGVAKNGKLCCVEKWLGGNSRGNTNRLATFYIRLKQEEESEKGFY